VASPLLLAAATVVGVGFGVVLQRSRLCYASMLSDLFLFRSLSRNGQGLLLATALTMLAWSSTYFARGAEGFWLPAWGWFGLVGGAVFGVGMITAGCCMMSALYRAGGGDLGYLVVLASTAVGYLGYGLLYPVFLDHYFTPLWVEAGGTLFAGPVPAPLVAVAALAVGLLAYAWLAGRLERQFGSDTEGALVADGGAGEATRVSRGPVTTVRVGLGVLGRGTVDYLDRRRNLDSLRAALVSPWDPRTGGVALAVLAAGWLWLSGVWTVSGPEAGWVALAADAAGLQTPALRRWAIDLFGAGGPAVTPNMAVFAGAGLGAVLSAVATGEFSVRLPDRETLPYATTGGLLMGVGASLAPGCNIGNMFTGVAQLSVHGLVASAGMVAGAYAATRLLY
jgi:uncharacterized membrane protein YedE/YeeE